MGRALVLPQSNVLDFVDSPLEALLSLRNGWGRDEREGGRNWRKGRREEVGTEFAM